ncbi:hypothetical protein EDD18DRAFT_1133865 [Armillaria luteobubalina]|uniref:Uncharacterized protein n=1 Tax=Armillaria luteobubalina TaxID=153913 RepID=A0AA39QML3_9AGAR|nr:hypothetical protein EDD18DRAFT_1133865 [Armillaria luteobubalina]
MILYGFLWLALGRMVNAHVAAWHKGMYCLNGTVPGVNNQNTADAVQPLYQLTKDQWWFHHYNGCDEFPPAEGDFLELPVNGQFTVELAVNRAFTTLSYNGAGINDFGDGQAHPEFYRQRTECISSPNIHTQNESMAAGTAFAISYNSDIADVTPENLVVFSVLQHTVWKRVATYSVPNLPACPPDGCICAWGWVPNGCGTPNMYMQGFKCKVTGRTGNAALATAKPPVWCEGKPSSCVSGAKQMIFWHQLDGNNIETSGYDSKGSPKSPAYSTLLGWQNGAQTDIFLSAGTATSSDSSGALSVFAVLGKAINYISILYFFPIFIY